MDARKRRALVKQLKMTNLGWRTRWEIQLPREAGVFLGMPISVHVSQKAPVGVEPPLAAHELKLLGQILEHLPKLMGRAEKAFGAYGGHPNLDEDERLAPARIVIRREDQAPERTGRWALIVEIRNSDVGWHIEFLGTRFKEIWSGD